MGSTFSGLMEVITGGVTGGTIIGGGIGEGLLCDSKQHSSPARPKSPSNPNNPGHHQQPPCLD